MSDLEINDIIDKNEAILLKNGLIERIHALPKSGITHGIHSAQENCWCKPWKMDISKSPEGSKEIFIHSMPEEREREMANPNGDHNFSRMLITEWVPKQSKISSALEKFKRIFQ